MLRHRSESLRFKVQAQGTAALVTSCHSSLVTGGGQPYILLLGAGAQVDLFRFQPVPFYTDLVDK